MKSFKSYLTERVKLNPNIVYGSNWHDFDDRQWDDGGFSKKTYLKSQGLIINFELYGRTLPEDRDPVSISFSTASAEKGAPRNPLKLYSDLVSLLRIGLKKYNPPGFALQGDTDQKSRIYKAIERQPETQRMIRQLGYVRKEWKDEWEKRWNKNKVLYIRKDLIDEKL